MGGEVDLGISLQNNVSELNTSPCLAPSFLRTK